MARKDLPSPNAPNFLLRVREEVHALLGKIGSSTDRALTLRDAIESGVIVPGPGGSLIPGPGAGAAEGPDLTPPPQPGAFTATGAISHFLISQAQPFYTQGHGHSRTVVYGAQWVSGPLPVFADAVELDRFGGTVRAIASNPATTWHLWIKWESVDGVLSATPSGGTNGVAVTTGQDVALLLDALAGQITTSELASSLSTPIGQIPSISGTAAEALSKANANLATIGTIQTELATLSGTPDYSASETYALDDIVKYSGGLYRALGTTTGNLPTNTTYWQKIGDYASLGDAVSAHAAQLSDHETRITDAEGDLTAQASDITQLQTDISTTNAAVATKASASALTALDTRVTAAEGMNTSQGAAITNLQNSVTTLNDGLSTKASASALNALDTRVTSAEGVNSSQATAITGLQASVTSLGDGLATKADASALTTTNTNVSNLAGTVSAQAGQITTLNSTIEGISVGGRNLLPGTDGGAGWTDWYAGNEFRITRSSTSESGYMCGPYINLTPGAEIVLSFESKQVGSVSSCDLFILSENYWMAGGGLLNASYPLSTEWNSNTFKFTVPAGLTEPMRVRFDHNGGDGSPSTVHVRKVKLEYGNIATDWTPAPEDFTAALQVEATTRATQTGELYAQYTVKTDVGGLVSGYGLASIANNAAPTSAFGVQAGQFFVAPPTVNQATAPTVDLFRGFVWRNSTTGLVQYWTGSAWSTTPQAYPFVVQLVPTTINGVAVPPGMYAESAFIMNGTITNAKIANLAVDDAKIANLSVSKLTAGSIAVGQFAQSTGYVAGSSGWRINGDGTAEFSGVVVRGTIFASQGAIGGWTIGSNYLQSTTYALGTSGTRLNSDGTGQIGGLTVLADKVRNTAYSDFFEGFELGGNGVIRAYSNVGQNELNTGATGTGFLLKAGTGFVLRANGDFSTNGRVRSPDGRTYFDPKASGSAPVFLVRDSAFSEKVRIEADGRAVFNDVVLSRPNIVASGTWTRPAGMPAWDISKNEGIWKFATPCVFVPTGYSVSEDVIQQGGPSFVGKALVTGTYMSPSQPGDVVVYRPRVSAVVVFQSDHYVSGSVGAPGGELVLRLDFDLPIAIRSNILAIRYTSINWSLARLT